MLPYLKERYSSLSLTESGGKNSSDGKWMRLKRVQGSSLTIPGPSLSGMQ